MKTVLQELIEYLENTYYIKEILDWEDIKKNILEKEKEQMLESSISGSKGNSFEYYYNKTYNQNK